MLTSAARAVGACVRGQAGVWTNRSGLAAARGVATMATGVSVVWVTVPPAAAEQLAQDIVREKLAACVNIIPTVQSVYTWQGKMENDKESMMMIKTATDKLPALRDFINHKHPYDLPEFITVQLDDANSSRGYLDWVLQAVGVKPSP